jgi:putative N6-adenine-specific DNA methylase
MMTQQIVATCAMGLESELKHELTQMGYSGLQMDNGRISFNASTTDIIHLNLWSRIAGRILIKLAQFKATNFDELFNAIEAIDWRIWCPKNGRCTIDAVSTKDAVLYAKSTVQSIAKKAIVTSLQSRYNIVNISETGPHIPIRIDIKNDTVTVFLDSSGHGLNKRGYRTRFDAPLRETLAAGILKLSRWKPDQDVLLDPFCGSGTILIEAALMANNIAPGLNQTFCSETWPMFSESDWTTARSNAISSQKTSAFRIYGSDINPEILNTARFNFKRANVDGIFVETKGISSVRSRFDKGKIITNPPYGIRIHDESNQNFRFDKKTPRHSIHRASTVETLYTTMGAQFKTHFKGWDYYILCGDMSFEDCFNKKASKKRKLFNGNIQCNLYQYFSEA